MPSQTPPATKPRQVKHILSMMGPSWGLSQEAQDQVIARSVKKETARKPKPKPEEEDGSMANLVRACCDGGGERDDDKEYDDADSVDDDVKDAVASAERPQAPGAKSNPAKKHKASHDPASSGLGGETQPPDAPVCPGGEKQPPFVDVAFADPVCGGDDLFGFGASEVDPVASGSASASSTGMAPPPPPDPSGPASASPTGIAPPPLLDPSGSASASSKGMAPPPTPDPSGPASASSKGMALPPLPASDDDEPGEAPGAAKVAPLKTGTCPTWAVSIPISDDHFRPTPGPCGPKEMFRLQAHPTKDTVFHVFEATDIEGKNRVGTLAIVKERLGTQNASSRWRAECNHGKTPSGVPIKCSRGYSTSLYPDAYFRAARFLYVGHGLTRAEHHELMLHLEPCRD